MQVSGAFGCPLGWAVAVLPLLVSFVASPAQASNPFLDGRPSGSTQHPDKAVVIVLDASGSMQDPGASGDSKMLMAKRVLEKVLSRSEDSVSLGLRVYGSSGSRSRPCQDSQLLVKPGVDNRGKILRSLRQVAPAGATPISYAMRRAIEDLETTGAREKSVVLISDGMDTCGFDPCALAESLDASGTQAQFNVVGFGTDGKANQQLECIASSTSGRFYTAQTNAKLAESILDGIRYHHSEVKGKILD